MMRSPYGHSDLLYDQGEISPRIMEKILTMTLFRSSWNCLFLLNSLFSTLAPLLELVLRNMFTVLLLSSEEETLYTNLLYFNVVPEEKQYEKSLKQRLSQVLFYMIWGSWIFLLKQIQKEMSLVIGVYRRIVNQD